MVNESLQTIRINRVVPASLYAVNVEVNDKVILQNGVYKIKAGSVDSEGKLVETAFLTTRSIEDLLEYLNISLQFQHISLPIDTISKNKNSFGEITSYAIRQKTFEEGYQPISVEVGFKEAFCTEDAEILYKSGSKTVLFENLKVAYITATQKATPSILYSYSDLSDAYEILGYYNDGTSGVIRNSEYTHTSFFPTKDVFDSTYTQVTGISDFSSTGTRLGTAVDENGNRFGSQKVPGTNTKISYQKDIVVTYGSVSCTISAIDLILANPYTISLEGSPLLQQTGGQPFNLDGLTATITYANQFVDKEVTASNLFGTTYYGGASEVTSTKPIRISLADYAEYVQIAYNYTKEDKGEITSNFYDTGSESAVVPDRIDRIAIRFNYIGTMFFSAKTLPRTTGAALVTAFECNDSKVTSTFEELNFQIKDNTGGEGVTHTYFAPVMDNSTEEYYEGISKTIYNLDFSSISPTSPIGYFKDNVYLDKGLYLDIYLTNDAGLKAYKEVDGSINYGTTLPAGANYVRKRIKYYYNTDTSLIESSEMETADESLLPIEFVVEYGAGKINFIKPCSVLLMLELEQPDDTNEHRYWDSVNKSTIEFSITIRKGNLDINYTQLVNGSKYIIEDNKVNVLLDSVVENLENLNVQFKRNGSTVSQETTPVDYTIHFYSAKSSDNQLPYRGENSWLYKAKEGLINPALATLLESVQLGDKFFVFVEYSGNEYFYGGSTEASQLEISLILRDIENNENALVHTYDRSTSQSIIEEYNKQFNSVYTIRILDEFDHPIPEEKILHVDTNYFIEFSRSGNVYKRKLEILPRVYRDLEVTYDKELTYGSITEEILSSLKMTANDLIEDYYVLDETANITYFNTNGAQSSNLNLLSYGDCYTYYSTKIGELDRGGDYNCPRIKVSFKLNKLVLPSISIKEGTVFDNPSLSTVYTGKNIIFALDEQYQTISSFVSFTVTNAYRIDDEGNPIRSEIIPSYLYLLDQELGTLTMGVTGYYGIKLTENENCEWEESAQTTFGITILKDEFEITTSTNNPAQTAGIFMGVNDYVQIKGNGEKNNMGTEIHFTVPNSATKVYKLGQVPTEEVTKDYLENNGIEVPSTENLIVGGIYYVCITGVSSSYYFFEAGNVYGFSCSENYKQISYILPLKINKNELAKLEFRTDRSDLRLLEEENKKDYTVTIDLEVLSGKTEAILEYAYGTNIDILNLFLSSTISGIGAGAYRFILTTKEGSQILPNSYLSDLNAGEYIVIITPNSSEDASFTWSANAKNVAIEVVVHKAVVNSPNLVKSIGIYSGDEQSSLVGGTEEQWRLFTSIGVTATIYKMRVEDKEFDSSKATIVLEERFDMLNGIFTFLDSGNYYIEFHLPAKNYYWSTIENGSLDFEYDKDTYATRILSLATIQKYEVTAPELGAKRVHSFDNTSVDFSDLDGNLVVDDFVISYALENRNPSNPSDKALLAVGYYELVLTIESVLKNGKALDATNFIWVRNYADYNGLMYQNPELEDSYGYIENTIDDLSRIVLNYAIIETVFNININGVQSIHYSGFTTNLEYMTSLEAYFKSCATPRDNPSGILTEEDQKVLDESRLTVSYNDSYVGGSFKQWEVGDYNVRVNIEFPNASYEPLAFHVVLHVLPLPVSISVTGQKAYGDDASEIAWDEWEYYDTGNRIFTTTPLLTFSSSDITSNLAIGTYIRNNILASCEDDSINKNYIISVLGTIEIVPRELSLEYLEESLRKSIYGETINLYSIIKEVANILPEDESKIRYLLNASITDTSAGTQTVFYEIVNPNYAFHNQERVASTTWLITQKEVEVTLTLHQYYGEEDILDFRFTSIGTENVDVVFGSTVVLDAIEGYANYSIVSGKPIYESGFTSQNYSFKDAGKGKIVYKPLDVTIKIMDGSSSYYQQAPLAYEIIVNSKQSNAEALVELTQKLLEELTGIEGNTSNRGSIWSRGSMTESMIDKGLFAIFTSAYTTSEFYESLEVKAGPTANVGEYPIVGIAKTNEHFILHFESANYTISQANFVYTVNPYGTFNEQTGKYEATYDDQVHTLLSVSVEDTIDTYEVLYSLEYNGTYSRNVITAIDAKINPYRVYYKIISSTNNYQTIEGETCFEDIQINPATDNGVLEGYDFNFANGKAAKEKENLEAAWIYGLYSATTLDGFNQNGNQALIEPIIKYTAHSLISYTIYKDGSDIALLDATNSLQTLFEQAFIKGVFDAGVYKLVVKQVQDDNYNNYNTCTPMEYYFRVGTREILLKPDLETMYGFDIPKYSYSFIGAINKTGEKALTYKISADVFSSYVVGDYVGSYPASLHNVMIQDELESNMNYAFQLEEGSLTVKPRTIAITIESKQTMYLNKITEDLKELSYKIYKENEFTALPILTYGLYEKDAAEDLFKIQTMLNLSTELITDSVGDYPIYLSWTEEALALKENSKALKDNYEVYFVNSICKEFEPLDDHAVKLENGKVSQNCAGTYTILPYLLNVEWSQTSGTNFVYNAKPIEIFATATLPKSLDQEEKRINLSIVKYKYPTLEEVELRDAGSYSIVAKLPTEGMAEYDEKFKNYTTGNSTIHISITPYHLDVTIGDVTGVYGDRVDIDQVSIKVNNPYEEELGIHLSTLADENANVGVYSIEGTHTNTNYEIFFRSGSYRIEPRLVKLAILGYSDLAFKDAQNFSKIYDGKEIDKFLAKNDVYRYIVVEDQWQGASKDTLEEFALDLQLSVSGVNAGSYLVEVISNHTNYQVEQVYELNGSTYHSDYKILKKALTISADAKTIYGEEPNIFYTFAGFIAGESYEELLVRSKALENLGISTVYVNTADIDTLLTCKTSYIVGNSVGSYPTEILSAESLNFLNYEVSSIEGNIEVQPRKITPRNQTLVYKEEGYSFDTLTLEFDNTYQGEEITVIATSIKNNMGLVDKITNVGIYTIDLELTCENYCFEVEKNTVSVEVIPAEIMVSWEKSIIQLDQATQSVANHLVNFKSELMLYSMMNWTYVSQEYEDGSIETSRKTVELEVNSRAPYYMVDLSGTGSYSIEITLNDNIGLGANYRFLGTTDRTITLTFTASTSYYSLDICTSNKEYDQNPLVVDVSVNTHLNRYIKTVYHAVTYAQNQELMMLDSLTKEEVESILSLPFNQDTLYQYSMDAPVDAGYYIIYSVYNRVDQYAESFHLVCIAQKRISKPYIVDDEELTYNATLQETLIAGITDAMSWQLDWDVNATRTGDLLILMSRNAEAYKAIITLKDKNYTWGDEDEVILSWNIAKAKDQEIELASDTIRITYGDTYDLVYTLKYKEDALVTTLIFPYHEDEDYDGISPVTPKEVGTYQVFISVEGENFDSKTTSILLMIEKKEVKVSVTTSVEYGSNINLASLAFAFQGFVYEDNEEILVPGFYNFLQIEGFDSLMQIGKYPISLATKEIALSTDKNAKLVHSIVGMDNQKGKDNYYYVLDSTRSEIRITPKTLHLRIGDIFVIYGDEVDLENVTIKSDTTIPESYTSLKELLGITLHIDPNAQDVGSYDITLTANNPNYTILYVTGRYTINPRSVKILIKAGGGIYGSNIIPTTAEFINTSSIIFSEVTIFRYHYVGVANNGNSYDSYIAPKDAGRYIVTVEIDPLVTNNYVLEGNVSDNFVIQQRVIETSKITIEEVKYTGRNILPTLYDGSLGVVVGGADDFVADENGTILYRIDRKTTYISAGRYMLSLEVEDPYNLCFKNGETTFEVSFEIQKAINSVQDFTISNWTYGSYDASTCTPKVTLSSKKEDITLRFEYRKSSDSIWSTAVPTNAGHYLVRVIASATDNYEAFTSGLYEFEIEKKKLTTPTLDVITSGENRNDTYSGMPLLLNVLGYQSQFMAFTFTNSSVNGDHVTITATEAGSYSILLWITEQNQENYTWESLENVNEDGQLELVWIVHKKRIAKPTDNLDEFVVNGTLLKYYPIGFDDSIMRIKGNQSGFSGDFQAIVELKDTANYEWEDGTIDPLIYEWRVSGVSPIFITCVVIFSSLVVVSSSFAVGQLIYHRRKIKRQKKEYEEPQEDME